MKKRLLSLLLVLCLCAALLPVTALAEEPVIELKQSNINSHLSHGVLAAGSYKLTEDITLSSTKLYIHQNVTLDLNGHILCFENMDGLYNGVYVVGTDAHLTLRDSAPTKNHPDVENEIDRISGGLIYCGTLGYNRPWASVMVVEGATFTMEGGSIVFGSNTDNPEFIPYHAGGVGVLNSTFNMISGRIIGCSSKVNGGVRVDVNSTFNMTGGSIEDCHAGGDGGGVYVGAGCAFNMTGGEIKNCKADGNGGGVYINSGIYYPNRPQFDRPGGKFNMTGGTIEDCTAANGAGVYVNGDGQAELIPGNIKGEITGNWTEYIPPVDPVDPDYPLISILPALTKDLPFADVTSADWFYNDVKYAYETGLMTGTSADAFSPEAPVTRGMVMTILARREGIRTERYTPWYAAGCEWAKANGISDGSAPEAPVTREQLAAMLYRYAALKGRGLTAGENLNFTDASDISDYAIPALQWACGEAILTGSNGALHPQATATRAQLAAILHRYFG